MFHHIIIKLFPAVRNVQFCGQRIFQFFHHLNLFASSFAEQVKCDFINTVLHISIFLVWTVTRRPGVCFKSQLISRPEEDSWIWTLVTLTVINLRVLSSWLSTCGCTGGWGGDALWSFVTIFAWLPSTWVWMRERGKKSQVWKIRGHGNDVEL